MNIYDYNKIIILGNSGSGKSYLSKELSTLTGISLIHLDAEFWKPNWIETPKDEWIEKTNKLIKGNKWIIDGNYNSTLDIRFKAADLVIFLDINPIVCLFRVITRHGKKRSDLPDYLEEKFGIDFLKFCMFVLKYNKNKKGKIMKLHYTYPDKEFLIFKNRRDVTTFLSDCLIQMQKEALK